MDSSNPYIPSISHLLQPLEDILRLQLIPTLTGRPPPNNSECDLLARLGGIGLTNLLNLSHMEYTASQKISQPLTNHILQQLTTYPAHIKEEQHAAIATNYRLKRHQLQQSASDLSTLSPSLQRAMTLAQEKGASSWLTALLINEFGFALHKGAFWDALGCLFMPPHHAPVVTASPCMEHILSCPKGGFPSIRHNEIREITTTLLSEVCHDVAIELHLQTLSGEAFPHATPNIQQNLT